MAMRSMPSATIGGRWRNLDLPWVKIGSSWRKIDNAWVCLSGQWRPLWDKITLPQVNWNSQHVGGRNGSIGGTLWGNTRLMTYWDLPTVRRVIGVVIDVTLQGKQGSWHGSGGRYGAGQTQPDDWPWEASSGDGVKRSTVLPCSFAAGERITVWAYGGGSDQGDGKGLKAITIVDIIYG